MKWRTIILNGVILLSCFFFASDLLLAQQLITGRVTFEDADPVPGVTVIVEGTTRGTVTNPEGIYQIEATKGETLVFSFVGYMTQRIQVEDQTTIDIVMSQELTRLDEVIVIGYGTIQRSRMSTSVSRVDDRVLESAPRSNVGSALTGAVPGLRVQNVDGKPGSTPSIIMRGGTTWDGGGSPLVLIDGVVSSFYALNSEDVESIEVLKDAAATSIYGARAANGVILVTTRRGRPGDAQVSYSYKFGTNMPRYGYEHLSGEDYIRINRMGWKDYVELTGRTNFNTYVINPAVGWTATQGIDNTIYTTQYLTPENEFLLNEPGWKRMRDPLYGETIGGRNFNNEWIIYQDNDMTRLPFQTSAVHDHHLSVRGGDDRATYALGLGYMDDVGSVLGAEFKRFTGNLNADYRVTNNIKVGTTISFASSSNINTFITSYNNIFQRFVGQPPTARIYNLDGSVNPGLNSGFGNPLYYQDKFLHDNLEQRLRASANIDWNILPGLILTVRGSYFNIHNSNESFNRAYITGGNLITDRNAGADYRRNQTLMANAVLNYSTSFYDDHNLSTMVGTEYYDFTVFTMSGGTRYSPTDLIPTMNVGAEPRFASSFHTGNRLVSAFGRVNYDYQLKYLVQFNFRYDGSSKLRDYRWGFFPGISAAWNIHREDFFNDSGLSNYISSVKPRISYGVNGNVDAISDFGALGTYGLSPIYEGLRGYYNTSLPTLGLRWESATTLNLGLDIGLLNENLSLEINYFIRDVRNKVAPYQLPSWTGFSSINTNIGTLRNKGFELDLNANIINRAGGLRWDVGLMAYTVKNYVVKLPDNDLPKNRQGGTEIFDPKTGEVIWVGGLQEGERVDTDLYFAHVIEFLYRDYDHVNQYPDRFDAYHYGENAMDRHPGLPHWKDLNNDGIIDYRDRVIRGRSTPDWMGGLSTGLNYNGLGLYVKADYQVGHYIYNNAWARGMSQVQGSQNAPIEALDTWTPENPDAKYPRYVFVNAFGNHGASGRFPEHVIEKASFLSLREVTLSYDLSSGILPGFIGNARIFLTGQNLHYFTGFRGNNPESGGTDGGRYPLPRVYTLGANVTF